MIARTPLVVVCAAIGWLVTVGSAQEPRTVRWQETGSHSSRLGRDGHVIKQLVIDGAIIRASIVDRVDSLFAYLEIDNTGPHALDVRSDRVHLEVIRPHAQYLAPIGADTLAEKVRRVAKNEAAGVESLGLMATTTIHEQVPVIETSFNPASIADPTQPATLTTTRTEIVVKTVPDEAARARAQADASHLRRKGEADARDIGEAALRGATVAAGSRVTGRVYFQRDLDVQDVVLRASLGTVTIEIPFAAVKRRPFPWNPILLFN